MRSVILWVGVVCLALWFVRGGEPVSAEDGEKDTVDTLRAELSRTRTVVTHLREAYNQLAENATRATRAVTALTVSLNAARDMIATLERESQRELAKVTAERDERERALAVLNEQLAAAQEAHAGDQVRRGRGRSQLAERADRAEIGKLNAENALAVATKRHASELLRCHEHYGRLLASIGKPTLNALLALLANDPAAEASRVCPILGWIGAEASEAIPALERIVADKNFQRHGAARFAEEALKAIRATR